MRILRRLGYLLRIRRYDADLLEELDTHRAMTQERLERAGLSPDDAVSASRRALGNVTLAREDAREIWIRPSLERLRQDVRYAVRMLVKQPTFTAAAVLTLGVGIGAATTVVSVVEAELWRPLPFSDVDRLAAAYLSNPGEPLSVDRLSGPQFLVWRAESQAFEEVAGYGGGGRRVLRGRESPEFVRTSRVTGNFFSTLGWRPALGRTFTLHDERAPQVAILTDASWRRFFDGAPDVIGRSIVLDADTYVVVGVMPARRIEIMQEPDVFLPIDFAAPNASEAQFLALGKVRHDATLENAAADLRLIQARLDSQHPPVRQGLVPRVDTLRSFYIGFNWRPLYFFLAAAGFVLLLSCANVANLLLARALRRQREFAIRSALGGGRAALVRQLLVEGAVLAIPGTVVGLLFAAWSTAVVGTWIPSGYISRGGALHINAVVAAIAVALGAVTSVLFGLAPAIFTRMNLNATLAPAGRALGGSAAQRRIRHALVVSEVALAFVLVFGAGLFFGSFERLTNQPLGFEPQNRVSFALTLTGLSYADGKNIVMFANRVREASGGVAGVAQTAIATSGPLGSGPSVRFSVSGRPADQGSEERCVLRAVTPSYFETVGIRHVAGRLFTEQDAAGSARVAVINENLARRSFGQEDAVGREIVVLPGGSAPWMPRGLVQIVGVVANSKDVGMNEIDFNGLYVPFAQAPSMSFQLFVRSAVPPAQVADEVRNLVHAADKDLPAPAVTMMTARVADAVKGDRFNLILIGSFALLALLLACVAIYAAMAYAVEQRTAEFGLRLALGAQRLDVLGNALWSSMRLGLLGTAIGFGTVVAIARAIGDALYLVPRQHEGLLYGITTTDPATLAITCTMLIGVAALAGLVPAGRAMRVDPAVALRDE